MPVDTPTHIYFRHYWLLNIIIVLAIIINSHCYY